MYLKDLVEIIIPKQYKKAQKGELVTIVSVQDFASSGYTTSSVNSEIIDDKNYAKFALKEYDVLLSKHGEPFGVGIIDKLNKKILANSNIFILRVKDTNNIKDKAISLYMYLKSNKGQKELSKIVAMKVHKIISRKELELFDIPDFDNSLSKIVEDFYKDQSLYEEILNSVKEIQNLGGYFDAEQKSNDLGICKMCKKTDATYLRVDTWQPFKKGIPMCDECSKNIMF